MDVHLCLLIIQACLLRSDTHPCANQLRAPLNPACGCYCLTPPLPFLPSPVFSCFPSLPVGQSEDRSDGSSSGAGAGTGECSVLTAADTPGHLFSLINGHRRTRSPCCQREVRRHEYSWHGAAHLMVCGWEWWRWWSWVRAMSLSLIHMSLNPFQFLGVSFLFIIYNGESKPMFVLCTNNYWIIVFKKNLGIKSEFLFKGISQEGLRSNDISLFQIK